MCVAFSGGPDSTALLAALVELEEKLGVRISACHFDHGFREGSAEDAGFAARAAEKMGVEIVTERNELGKPEKSIQQTGREMRYGFFQRLLDEGYADAIATGHTLDDSVETSIMWMLRGAGPSAFGGIPPVRGSFVRPLIETRKRDIISWLEKRGIEFIKDPSNDTDDYLRNRIRHHIIPAMEREAPGAVEAVSRLTTITRSQEAALDAMVENTLDRLIVSSSGNRMTLAPDPLSEQPDAVRWSAYRMALKRSGLEPAKLEFCHIESIDDLVISRGLGREIDLPEGYAARIDHAGLTLGKRANPAGFEPRPFSCPLEAELAEGLLRITPVGRIESGMEIVDVEKIPESAVIRTRRAGDFLRLKNLKGRKKLKSFLIDRKTPSGLRARMPLLADGSEILWVPGLFVSPSIAPGSGSKILAAVGWIR